MFIHIGGEQVVRASELIGIFDLSIEKMSKISTQFLEEANKDKRVEIIGEEESKSFIVTSSTIYYSPISSMTLKKRVSLSMSDWKRSV